MTRTPPSVLVVEDDEDLRTAVAEALELSGYQVQVAVDGHQALAWLHAGFRPGAIILDLYMPGMNGFEFYRQVRAAGLHDVPLVLMTGADPDARKDIEAAATLRKPVDSHELLYVLRSVMNGGETGAHAGDEPAASARRSRQP